MKRAFVLIANKASTAPFKLNDLAGAAGRMDIVCRCIAQSLLLSHSIRKNVVFYSILLGNPDPPKAIKVVGDEVKYLGPDERNIAGLIKKALSLKVSENWVRSTPGFYIARRSLSEILNELKDENFEIIYLKEDGVDIRNVVKKFKSPAFILGDHLGVPRDLEKIILEFADYIVSLLPISLQADQCILIANYEIDRIRIM